MSWATQDLREPILQIFEEAQCVVARDNAHWKLERIAAERQEKNRLLYHWDGRRKRKILERAKTEAAKKQRRERLARTRAPRLPKNKSVSSCSGCHAPIQHGNTRCIACKTELSRTNSAAVVSALSSGFTERNVASMLGLTKAMVHRIKLKGQ